MFSKMKKYLKKSLLFLFVMIAGMFVSKMAVNATEVRQTPMRDVGGYNAKLPGNYAWENELPHKFTIENLIALCLELTRDIFGNYSQVSTNDLTIRTFDVNGRVIHQRNLTREDLKLISLYGYVGIVKSDKTNVDIAATQYLTWEVANQADFGYGSNPLGPWRAFSLNGVTYKEPTDAVKRRFAEIKEEARKLQIRPSFHNETITLKLNESVTLTDTNHVIDKFMATKNNDFTQDGIRYQLVNGNQLVVTLVDATTNVTASPRIYNVPQSDEISLDDVKLFKSGSGGQTLFQPTGMADPERFTLNFNIVKSAHVEILKVDEKGNVVPGVVFEQSTKPDFSSDTYEFTTGADGIARDTWNRGDVTIYVREKSVPSHLVKSNEVKQVQLITGQTTKIQFINQIVRGNVEVLKVAEHDANVKLNGVTFELRKGNDVIATQTTNSDGIARFENIEYGNYTLVETATIAGYGLPENNTRNITINQNNQTIRFTIENEKTPEITTQAHGEGQAVREVVEPKEKQMITETAIVENTVKDGKYRATIYLVDVATKAVLETRIVEFVAEGTTHTITENFEVNGFEHAEGVTFSEDLFRKNQKGEWELKATHNKNYEDKNQTVTFKKYGKLTVKKVDANDQTTVLEGAEFTLYRDGIEIAKGVSGKDGIVVFEKLIEGVEYELKETNAPVGYLLPSESKKITLTVEQLERNEVFEVPNSLLPVIKKEIKTGDSSNVLVYGMSAMLAVVGLFILRKKED